jgi:hypothetical protein
MVKTATVRAEHPLTYLPRKPVQSLAKGQLIYDSNQPCNRFHAVIQGRVKLVHTAVDGCQIVARFVWVDGFLGVLPNCFATRQRNRDVPGCHCGDGVDAG